MTHACRYLALVSVLGLLVACGDDGGDDGGAGGSGGSSGTAGDATGSGGSSAATCGGEGEGGSPESACTEDELREWSECQNVGCGAIGAQCYGDGFAEGDLTGGKCAPYTECVLDCTDGCETDTDCVAACAPHLEENSCSGCVASYSVCIQSRQDDCPPPACATP